MTTTPDTAPHRDTPARPEPITPDSATRGPSPAGPSPSSAVRAPRLRLVRYEPDPEVPIPAPRRPVPVPPPARPEVEDGLRPHAQHVLRLALEILDGRRLPEQLAGHLAPSALRYLRAAARRGAGPSRLSSVRICRPRPGAAEVAAVYRRAGRARALAARFEHRPGVSSTWQCTALRLG